MSRCLTLLCLIAGVVAGCSRGADTTSAGLPTAPSAATSSILGQSAVAPGGVSGPMDVAFPGRNETFVFRQLLDTKYQTGLGRPASTSFVDSEGEVVWTQEYIRYRVNGCDHATAVQRVFAQIDGNPPGAACGAMPTGEIGFPSRDQVLDFRRQLESKYEQLSRGLSSSFVDLEGAAIWIQEYLRYRINGCDHATATQKVFSQIDGNGVAPTCYVPPEPCNYRVTPTGIDVSPAAGTYIVSLFAIPGGCEWTVSSDASWLTITPPTTGTGWTQVSYTVQANQGAPRRARVRFSWVGGSATQIVDQAQTPFNVQFQMFDPSQSVSPTTECQIRMASTPCNFVATANLTSNQTFAWTATYLNVVQKTFTQTGASATFGFTEACGAVGSTATGVDVALSVTLTVTDTNGNTQTVRSGEWLLPALKIKLFTC